MAAFSRFLTLPQAARKFGLSEEHLRQMAEMGKINAAILPDGEVGVSEDSVQGNLPKEELPEYKKHAHLKGVGIGIGEAARRYKIPDVTIGRWVKAGYITRIGQDGQKIIVDEADVAYCAEVYYVKQGQGRWLFNRDGTPYRKTGLFPPSNKATTRTAN